MTNENRDVIYIQWSALSQNCWSLGSSTTISRWAWQTTNRKRLERRGGGTLSQQFWQKQKKIYFVANPTFMHMVTMCSSWGLRYFGQFSAKSMRLFKTLSSSLLSTLSATPWNRTDDDWWYFNVNIFIPQSRMKKECTKKTFCCCLFHCTDIRFPDKH